MRELERRGTRQSRRRRRTEHANPTKNLSSARRSSATAAICAARSRKSWRIRCHFFQARDGRAKFHGIYQQDDRDLRNRRPEREFSAMVRVGIRAAG